MAVDSEFGSLNCRYVNLTCVNVSSETETSVVNVVGTEHAWLM